MNARKLTPVRRISLFIKSLEVFRNEARDINIWDYIFSGVQNRVENRYSVDFKFTTYLLPLTQLINYSRVSSLVEYDNYLTEYLKINYFGSKVAIDNVFFFSFFFYPTINIICWRTAYLNFKRRSSRDLSSFDLKVSGNMYPYK